jgi:hypothetical protein
MFDRNLSATNMFLSFDLLAKKVREFVCFQALSIATQSQLYPDHTFNIVSSTICSGTFLPVDFNFWG